MNKRIIIAILTAAMLLTGCGSSDDDSSKARGKSSAVVKTADIKNVDEYLAKMTGIEVTDTKEKMGNLIGADKRGLSFKANEKTFELYMFPDGSPEIDKASTGTYTFIIEGYEDFGEMTMSSAVNGNFVLLFKENDDTVINEFLSVKA